MSLLQKNRPFFIFLLKFGLSYLVLSVAYWLYLQQYDAAAHEPDGVTYIVSVQAKWMVGVLGDEASLTRHPREASYYFYVNGDRVARIVEGCNAVSVMILFAAFIVAFSSTLKKTVLYISCGVGIIHFLNILRVALFCMGLHYYPEYGDIMHDIVFPLFIYGVVFLLWILWVQKYSGYAKKAESKTT